MMNKKTWRIAASATLLAGVVIAASLFIIQAPIAAVASASSCVAPPANMVSWWPGDGNTNDIIDGNLGTLQNGATFAAGNVGQGFSFGGVNDRVLIGNPANLRLQDFTIDAWIKLNTLTIANQERIAGYGIGGYGFFLAGPGVLINGATAVRQLSLDKAGFDMVAAPLAINDLGWHHVAVTKSGGTVTFYLDGIAAGAQRGGNPFPFYNPGFVFDTNFTLGNFDTQVQPFPGLLDEVQVFNRALTSSEIQSIYNAGSAGQCKVPPAPVTPPPPAFSRPISSIFPNAPFLSCLQGHFEHDSADRHYWFIKPKTSGPLTVDVRAISVNPAETGSMNANLFDGLTLLGGVTVNHPTGTFPGDQNIGFMTFAADSTRVYRLEVQRGIPAPNTQQAHHYKLSMTGIEADLGINSPSFRYLEHNRQEVFQMHTDRGENFMLNIITESPDFGANQATSITIEILERTMLTPIVPATILVLPPAPSVTPVSIPNVGTGTLVVKISANGHYRLHKTSGTDRGIYFDTCTPAPKREPGTATRTQGFWSTHFDLARDTWLAINPADRMIGSKNLADGPQASDTAEMMGGFWSSVARKTDGNRRSPLDQARMQLVQQLFAAMLNLQAFNTNDNGLISAGKLAYTGTDRNAILNAAGALATFNQSGDTEPIPDNIEAGSADPQTSQSNANKIFWTTLP